MFESTEWCVVIQLILLSNQLNYSILDFHSTYLIVNFIIIKFIRWRIATLSDWGCFSQCNSLALWKICSTDTVETGKVMQMLATVFKFGNMATNILWPLSSFHCILVSSSHFWRVMSEYFSFGVHFLLDYLVTSWIGHLILSLLSLQFHNTVTKYQLTAHHMF